MVIVKKIETTDQILYNPSRGPLGAEDIFKSNPLFHLRIEAPMYWWLDSEFEKYHTEMPKDDFKFCLDSWDVERNTYLQVMQGEVVNNKLTPRQLMQILPLSTYLEGDTELTYQQIVEICENYNCGEYDYEELYNQWPMSREWADFCETLMDITGVREIIEKEGM